MGMSAGSNDKERERFALFLLPITNRRIEEGWQSLHLLLWKYVIASLVRVDTEGASFAPHAIWEEAWRRFKTKAAARSETLKTKILRAESRGEDPPNMEKAGRVTEPLASVSATGEIVWNADIQQRILALGQPPSGKARKR